MHPNELWSPGSTPSRSGTQERRYGSPTGGRIDPAQIEGDIVLSYLRDGSLFTSLVEPELALGRSCRASLVTRADEVLGFDPCEWTLIDISPGEEIGPAIAYEEPGETESIIYMQRVKQLSRVSPTLALIVSGLMTSNGGPLRLLAIGLTFIVLGAVQWAWFGPPEFGQAGVFGGVSVAIVAVFLIFRSRQGQNGQ